MKKSELERLRRDVPLLHVVYAVEEKAKEMENLGALPEGIPPVRVLSAFGLWSAIFVLKELAACGNADAKQWADDLAKSRDNYRKR